MGKKILLADDSITIQKVIELTFSDEDFEVVTVGNGRLAIERVQDVRPDIVLCDIIMPEKDGYEVCDYIKRTPSLAHIPVLLLTGAFEPFDQERAARVGCDGFLAKPFEPQTLIAKVRDLLSQSQARGAAAAAKGPAPVEAAATPEVSTQSLPAVPAAPAWTPAAAVPFAHEPAPASPAPSEMAPPQPAMAAPVLDDEPFFTPDEVEMEPEPPAAPSIERAPAAPAAPAEVRFIPEEETFAPPAIPAKEAAPSYTAFEPVEQLPDANLPGTIDSEAFTPVEDVPAEEPELLPVTPEEAETLGGAPPWAQPTAEVPLEERARASVESQQASSEPFFEEIFEEEPLRPIDEEPPAAAASPERPIVIVHNTERFEVRPPDRPAEPVRESPAPAPAVPAPPPEPRRLSALESEPEVEEELSFADIKPAEPAVPPPPPTEAGEVAVPVEMVSQIAQRVVAQISEKVVREIAWEVIPDLAEALIKKEIERLKAELQQS